jgi:tetratricopeptide (TPR) repeat protein
VEPKQCPPDLLDELVIAAKASEETGLAEVESLLRTYPADSRLHFLEGSLLAGLRRYGEARQAMRKAVDLAPGLAVARFQLGFLELTSGDPAAAEATWRPLDGLPKDNALRLFAQGLGHLMRDEFQPAIEVLEWGIKRNVDNPPLNDDMRLIIAEIRLKLSEQARGEEPSSSAQMLLNQFSQKPTKH